MPNREALFLFFLVVWWFSHLLWHLQAFAEFDFLSSRYILWYLSQTLSTRVFWVLTWYVCLMFILLSQLLQCWALSINQFCRFLRLCSSKAFFVFQMVSLIILLKEKKGCPLKMLLKGTRGLHNTEKFPFGISAFAVFWMVLYRVLSSGSFWNPLGPHFSFVCYSVFFLLIVMCTVLFFFFVLFFPLGSPPFFGVSCQPISCLSLLVASGLVTETQHVG